MSLLIVGSVAFDSVSTPFGKVERALGGSAIYSSMSAKFFVKPSILAIVGKDFKKKYLNLLKKNNIDISSIKISNGKTFFWQGYYSKNFNKVKTIETKLNVFSSFNPILNKNIRKMKFIFLANIQPELQLKVYRQVEKPQIVASDTMNCWIKNKNKELKDVLKITDILFINEFELRQLTKIYNTQNAAYSLLKNFGIKAIVVKKGEYGSICFYKNKIFSLPSYPLEKVCDPTGAGDSFAGAVMGFLASKNFSFENFDENIFRQSLVFGTILASYCIEDFSVKKLININYNDILKRYSEFKKITKF